MKSNINAGSLMTSEVATCHPGENCSAAVQRMWDCDCGTIPVVDDESRLIGIVTDRDICMATHFRDTRPAELPVESVMQADVQSCRENTGIVQILEIMSSHRIRRVPVTDNNGRCIGIVSLNDIVMDPRMNKDYAPEVLKTLRTICQGSVGSVVSGG